jgi:hypothetical protein
VEKCGTAGEATDDNITKRMPIASWITRATNTHSEYVTHNALRRQQCFDERVSVLFCILKIIISSRSAVELIKNYGNYGKLW